MCGCSQGQHHLRVNCTAVGMYIYLTSLYQVEPPSCDVDQPAYGSFVPSCSAVPPTGLARRHFVPQVAARHLRTTANQCNRGPSWCTQLQLLRL